MAEKSVRAPHGRAEEGKLPPENLPQRLARRIAPRRAEKHDPIARRRHRIGDLDQLQLIDSDETGRTPGIFRL
jgi:IS5 family transposase